MDYLTEYARAAKQRRYRPVVPRDPLTWPVLIVLGIVVVIVFALQVW